MTQASDGAAVSGESYRGKVAALYFGYTNRPDVCPATLANLTAMLERLGSKDVQVLFVTVDPAAIRRSCLISTPKPSRLRSRACAAQTTSSPIWRGAIASPIRSIPKSPTP